MKTIVIGDIHGLDYWKRIIDSESFDNVIFLGDYFDSFDISSAIQIFNFKNIVNLKNNNIDNVVLLIGNHDFHYFKGIGVEYSGFQHLHAFDIGNVVENAYRKNIFNIAYNIDNIVFTHAGLSKVWCENNDIDTSDISFVNYLNELFFFKLKTFHKSSYNPYGESITECPLWIRPNSLKNNLIDNYIQVVGHTGVKKPMLINNKLWLNDALPFGYYLLIDDGEIIIKNI